MEKFLSFSGKLSKYLEDLFNSRPAVVYQGMSNNAGYILRQFLIFQ